MKCRIYILFVFSAMIFSPIVNVRAAECNGSDHTTSKIVGTIQRADVIITKYRYSKGVIQYRRWNETKGVWVDDDWINL